MKESFTKNVVWKVYYDTIIKEMKTAHLKEAIDTIQTMRSNDSTIMLEIIF